MLYLNLMRPIQIWECKLLLESMLLNKGWIFQDGGPVSGSGCETYLQYSICPAHDHKFDTTLARSSFDALNGTMIQDLYTIANISCDPNQSSEDVLKLFLLSHPDVRTERGDRPTQQDINELFRPLKDYIKKLYKGHTLTSIMADTPRVKFMLIKKFGTWKNYNNDIKLKRNHMLGNQLCTDFIEYAKTFVKVTEDVDDKFGHAGTDRVELIGTVLAYTAYFIPRWYKEKYKGYRDVQALSGSGDQMTDLADFQTVSVSIDDDVNIGQDLRELMQINDVLFKGKDGSRSIQGLWYNLVAFYQNIYLGNTLNEISIVYRRFAANRWDKFEAKKFNYEELPLEDLKCSIVFNMARKCCLQLTNEDDTNVRNSCRSGSVVFLSSRGTSREYMPQSKNYTTKFKLWIPTLFLIYKNLETIDITNIIEQSTLWTCNSTTSKDIFTLDADEVKGCEESREFTRKMLSNLYERYNVDSLPANAPIYEFALILYGLRTLKQLDEYLQSEGYTIMDLPTEAQFNPYVINSIDSIADMIDIRSTTQWKFGSEFRLDTSARSKIHVCTMFRDAQVKEWLKMPIFDEVASNVSLPTGKMFNIMDTTGLTADEEQQERQYFLHSIEPVQQSSTPIPEPYGNGRSAYIVDNNVKRVKFQVTNNQKAILHKISSLNLILSLMLHPDLEFSSYSKSDPIITACQKRIDELKDQHCAREGVVLTEEMMMRFRDVREANSSLITLKYKKIRGIVQTLEKLLDISEISPFCNTNLKTLKNDSNFIMTSNIQCIDDLMVYIGCLVYLASLKPKTLNLFYSFGLLKPILSCTNKNKVLGMVFKCNTNKVVLGLERFLQDWKQYKGYLQSSFTMLQAIDYADSIDKFIDSTVQLGNQIQELKSALKDIGRYILSNQRDMLICGGNVLFDMLNSCCTNLHCVTTDSLNQYNGIRIKNRVIDLTDPNLGKIFAKDLDVQPTSLIYEGSPDTCLLRPDRAVNLAGVTISKSDDLNEPYYDAEDRLMFIAGLDARVHANRFNRLEADLTSKFVEPSSELPIIERLKAIKSNQDRAQSIKNRLQYRSKFANRFYLFNAEGKPRTILDLQVATQLVLSSVLVNDFAAELSYLGVKDGRKEYLSDWQILLDVMIITVRSFRTLSGLFGSYNRLIATLDDFENILVLRRKHQVSADNFRKNRIYLAKYTDAYQLIMLRDRQGIENLKLYMNSLTRLSENIRYKSWASARGVLKSIDISYFLGHEQDPQFSDYFETFYRCVRDVAGGIFSEDVYTNVTRMLTTLDRFQRMESSLLKLDRAGALQAKANKQRFEQYRQTVTTFINSPKFRRMALNADHDSRIMIQLRSKYSVDKTTGVFYDPRLMRYFLVRSDYPTSTDYDKFDVLVHQSGIMLIVVNQDTIIPKRLCDIDDNILNALI